MPVEKKMGMRDALVYHPSKDQLQRIVKLHMLLTQIADSKANETITPQEAIKQSVTAIRRVDRSKRVDTANGPLQRLERICSNGWIREAAVYLPQWYPELMEAEQSMSGRKKIA